MPMYVNYYKFTTASCIFFFLITTISAQFIENPSLEGVPAESRVPVNWSTCADKSNPDTQPGFWGVKTQPSHGNSYVSLVVRGNLGPNANKTEDIQTFLKEPLVQDNCYRLSFDAAFSETFGHDSWSGWISYDKEAKLRVWGGNIECDKRELLYESNAITNLEWETHTIPIKVTNTSLNYLIFEAQYVSSDTYFGNVLLDHVVLEELNQINTRMDTTVTFESQISLNASPGITYQWPDDMGLSCTDCKNAELTVIENGIYHVTVTQNNGCQHVEEFKVSVKLDIPNIITPNEDGVNDAFQILGNFGRMSFKVFNRWGVLVFESSDYLNNWDAMTNEGQKLPQGIYFYELRFQKNEKMHKGYVHVVY